MIDSGSYSIFINNAGEKLKLILSPRSKSLFLADPTCKAQVIGEVVVDLTLDLFVFRCGDGGMRLFVNVIIEKGSLQKHKQVTLKFSGSKDELIVGAVKSSGTFTAMRVAPLLLFTNVSCYIKPMTTKSRQYCPADSTFISKEVAYLLGEGIIGSGLQWYNISIH